MYTVHINTVYIYTCISCIYTCKILSSLFWADFILIKAESIILARAWNFSPQYDFLNGRCSSLKPWQLRMKTFKSFKLEGWSFITTLDKQPKEIQTSQLIIQVIPKENWPTTQQHPKRPHFQALPFLFGFWSFTCLSHEMARASAQRTVSTNERKIVSNKNYVHSYHWSIWESFLSIASLFDVPFDPHSCVPFAFSFLFRRRQLILRK